MRDSARSKVQRQNRFDIMILYHWDLSSKIINVFTKQDLQDDHDMKGGSCLSCCSVNLFHQVWGKQACIGGKLWLCTLNDFGIEGSEGDEPTKAKVSRERRRPWLCDFIMQLWEETHCWSAPYLFVYFSLFPLITVFLHYVLFQWFILCTDGIYVQCYFSYFYVCSYAMNKCKK